MRLFRRRLYADLAPKERIQKLLEEYIVEELSGLGFKFNKSQFTFTRKVDHFQQEIYLPRGKWNRKGVNVYFRVMYGVTSSKYKKWHTSTYGIPALGNGVSGGDSTNNKEWESRYCKLGEYDLQKYDNPDLMQDLLSNIKNIAIPFLEERSDWGRAAKGLLTDGYTGLIAKIFDFYILDDKLEIAQKTLQEVKLKFEAMEDVPEERFKEIELRENYLQQRIKHAKSARP